MFHPREYLSWSSMSLFEASQQAWLDRYLYNKKPFTNSGMELGKGVAEALESGKETGEILTDMVLALLPKYELMDKPFKASVSVQGVEIPIYGKIDTAKADLTAFREYKTGVTPWNQAKTDKHGQITFYCIIAQAITGQVPQDIELVWMPTEIITGEPRLTGEIKTFKTKRSTADILKFKIRMAAVWKKMGELCEKELI
jgi:hypothetical protein